MSSTTQISTLIQAAGQGDRSAMDEVWNVLYRQLHELAASQMTNERSGHLLQTTALVHEAWFRLSSTERSHWRDRGSFLSAAANVIRRVLIDSARKEKAVRRGGNSTQHALSDTRLRFDDRSFDAMEIDEALQTLATFAPDQAHALELMIFGGLSGEETAQVLGVSASTIDRRIRAAKAWLRRELSDG